MKVKNPVQYFKDKKAASDAYKQQVAEDERVRKEWEEKNARWATEENEENKILIEHKEITVHN